MTRREKLAGETFVEGWREAARLASLEYLDAVRPDADKVLQGLVDDVREVFGTDLCMVNLILSDAQYFRAWSGELPADLAEARRDPRERSMCRYVVEKEAPFVVEDFMATEEFRDQYFRVNYGIRFYAGTPLLTSDGSVLGSLCLLDARPRAFGEGDLAMLGAFARGAAGRLETLGALKREQAAREEEALRSRQLERILGSAGEGIVGLDPGGRIGFANPAAASMLGYEVREMVGRNMHRLVHHTRPDGSAYPLEECPNYLALREGIAHRSDCDVYWRKDGTSFPVEHTSNPVVEGGKVIGAVVTFSDVGERKRVEGALRESEERFRSLFDRSADALIVHDEQGRILDCNSEACRSLGYARDELLSLRVKDFADGLLTEEGKRERDGGTPWQRAVRGEPDGFGMVHYGEHRRKDGTTFPTEVRFGGVDYGGRRAILASVRDITERKQAQEALRRGEERFRSLVQNSSDIVTVISTDGTILYQTPSMKRILGHEPENRVGKNLFGNPLIHPEDAARQKDLIDLTVRDPGLEPLFEARLRHSEGPWRWVEGIISNQLSDPNVGGIVLNARDITERKRAEEALEESEERYRSLFDHNPDAVYAFDLKGCFLSANPACERLTGCTAGELSKMSFVPFIAPEDLEKTMRHFEGAARGEPQNYDTAITNRHGDRVDLNVTNLPIVVAGEVVGVYGIAKDVTERKRAEEFRSRLATIVESSEDAIVSRAADGTIVSWNRGAEKLYGYAAEEVVGRCNAFLYPPEHPREMTEIMEKIRRGETIRHYETVRVAKDGRRVDVSLTVSPTTDATGKVVGDSGIARDITERKRAEDEVRAVNRRHRETIDSAEAIIWRGDARTLRFTFVSHQAEVILGYPPERWTSEPSFWTEHMHPDDRGWALAFCRAATAEGRAHTFEYRMFAADGRVVWLRDSVHVVVRDGVPTELIGVMTDVTERKALEEQLRHQALHDPLTGLPNRTLFVDRLGHVLNRSGCRDKVCVAVLFLDLDDFKVVNDSLGHEAGDRLLIEAAGRLGGCLRPGDTLARIGGDEFVVLLEGLRGRGAAGEVARRITEVLREPFFLGEYQEVFVSASIGVALGGGGGPGEGSPDDLLRRADMAMYEAKKGGKAHHRLFEPRLDDLALQRLRTGTDLRRAVERGQFVLHYQPEVSLRTGEVVGFEALVRWEHPEHGLLPPARFVPVAEETGLVVPLGRWVLGEACRQAKAWRELRPGAAPPTMSVNLSARQFGHPDLVRDVERALRETGVSPSGLVLEITESAVMGDARATIETLGDLKGLGVGLAIDDFGTGYSSLSYLRRFPVDFLKVDRSFVEGLGGEGGGEVLVSSVVGMAHALGLVVVAEGVETEEQLGLLRGMGCELAQGYLFARPLPGEEAASLLDREAHRAGGYLATKYRNPDSEVARGGHR